MIHSFVQNAFAAATQGWSATTIRAQEAIDRLFAAIAEKKIADIALQPPAVPIRFKFIPGGCERSLKQPRGIGERPLEAGQSSG